MEEENNLLSRNLFASELEREGKVSGCRVLNNHHGLKKKKRKKLSSKPVSQRANGMNFFVKPYGTRPAARICDEEPPSKIADRVFNRVFTVLVPPRFYPKEEIKPDKFVALNPSAHPSRPINHSPC